jgi:hypothetical protein
VKAQPSLGVRKARREANALLRRMRAPAGKALDVEAIANLVRLRVERGELDGAAARLVRVGQHGTIRINARVTDVGSQRFSVAHELGHYVLGHATPEADEPCDGPTVHGYVDRGEECEANAFAAELLMPEPHLRRRCEVSPVSLGPARAIAADFEVSLMAAALRFVELTSERCALVFARDRRVAWASRSETFAPFLERGRLVGRDRLVRARSCPRWLPARPRRRVDRPRRGGRRGDLRGGRAGAHHGRRHVAAVDPRARRAPVRPRVARPRPRRGRRGCSVVAWFTCAGCAARSSTRVPDQEP